MTGQVTESTFTFDCDRNSLIGIIHAPQKPARLGLLILVGGPQYRVGAHRQYVHLARHAANAGFAAMRFDYRGVGDSEGEYPGFEAVGPDIDAAVTAFMARVPDLDGVVLWGLCEGASAILLSGVDNDAVQGIVLANPWINTAETEAQAYLKHYYGRRILSAETWKRMFRGDVNPARALGSLVGLLRKALGRSKAGGDATEKPYPERMAAGFDRFRGRTFLIMSERDLVAREFEDGVARRTEWAAFRNASTVERVNIKGSDHTFSREEWRMAAAAATVDFMDQLSKTGDKNGGVCADYRA